MNPASLRPDVRNAGILRAPILRWALLAIVVLGGSAALLAGLAETPAGIRMVSIFMAPYEKMLESSLPAQGKAEYLVFHTDEPERDFREALQALLPHAQVRTSTLPQVLVVTINEPNGRELGLLKREPYVRLAMTNSGFAYCH